MKKAIIILFIFLVAIHVSMAQTNEIMGRVEIKGGVTSSRIDHWFFLVDGGAAFFTDTIGGVSGDIHSDHAQRLRYGYTYGADACYYFNQDDEGGIDVGVGVRIRNTHTSHNTSITVKDTEGDEITGSLEDNINVLFINPIISTNFSLFGKRNTFFFNLSPFGLAFYTNNAVLLDRYTLSTNMRSMILEIMYDRTILKNLGIGTTLSFNACSYSDYTKTDSNGYKEIVYLSDGFREGLAHIAITASVSYSF